MKTIFSNLFIPLIFSSLILFLASCSNTPKTSNASNSSTMDNKKTSYAQTVYDFKVKDIDGQDVDLSKYKGKKLMIVNVASKCGFTPQYEDLQNVKEKYSDKITVLGFPANNFGGQEPGTNKEIKEFCSTKFNADFDMFSKVSVTGDDRAPLFAWLKEQTGEEPSWNFCKYVVSEDGKTVQFYNSRMNPMEIAEKL